jgi:hypothetical protein
VIARISDNSDTSGRDALTEVCCNGRGINGRGDALTEVCRHFRQRVGLTLRSGTSLGGDALKIVEGIREQAPGGRAFAPLEPTTLAIRQFRGFRGTKALLVAGDLRTASRS